MKTKQLIRFIKMTLIATVIILDNGCSSMGSNITESGKNVLQEPLKESNAPNIENNKDNTIIERKSYGYKNGDKYLTHYSSNHSVNQIILVEQSKEVKSTAKLFLLIKNDSNNWKEFLQCKAYLGKNGIDKTREGDARTPTGDYGFLMAFGAKENPGSLIPYTKLTDTMYLCGDKEYYNQFIDCSKMNHSCSNNSEHLIRYIPQYNYGVFIDYNKEGVYGKGSAIFLHCFGSYPYTMGCVSVAEENMVKILRTIDSNSRICIYPGS